MLKQAWHILHSFALSLHTGMVYPCTVGAPHLPPHLCHTVFFCFLGWAAVYALFPTLVKQREGTPPPSLSTGWTMPPPAGLFLHAGGQPRQYDCLIQRFSLWSGFMALWAGIATPQQAEEIVARQYLDTTLFCCPAGVRSLLPSREDVQHEGERQPLVVAGAGMDMCQLSRLPWASQVRIHRRGTSPGMEDNHTPRQGF